MRVHGFCLLPNRPNAGRQARGVTTEAVPATPRKGRRPGAVLSWPLAGPGRSGSGSSLLFFWEAITMADSQQHPFFIRIVVPTGDPDGLRILEKSNWAGVGVV